MIPLISRPWLVCPLTENEVMPRYQWLFPSIGAHILASPQQQYNSEKTWIGQASSAAI